MRRSDSCAYVDQPLHRVIFDDPVEDSHDGGPVALKSKFSRCRVACILSKITVWLSVVDSSLEEGMVGRESEEECLDCGGRGDLIY